MYKYDIEWIVDDHGAQVGKLLLYLPEPVTISDVKKECFNVYTARKDEHGNEINYRPVFYKQQVIKASGYRTILAAYPSDIDYNPARESCYITLELDISDTHARAIIGNSFMNKFVTCDYRIVQVSPIGTTCGLMFDELNTIRCKQTEQWSHTTSNYEPLPLQYAYFDPNKSDKSPLIIWLHGAGEGGSDVRLAYMGNNVVALSSEKIQSYFDSAWVLVPQAPTMWMDDGSHTYGRTGKSMYRDALKAVIDEFIQLHPVDVSRIYIGGCSNGGFMSMRMIIDYPEFFAAAYPMCEALFDETITDENIDSIKHLPIWLLHAMTDSVVNPEETSVPTYHRLLAAGAKNVILTYIDDRPPFEMVNHGAWVPGLRDEFNVDFSGQPVLLDGQLVTRFQWLAAQHR